MSGLLITGFEPFGGETVNPAQQLLKKAGEYGQTLLLPTSYRRSMEVLLPALERFRPATVLSVGQAGGREALSLERIGINWMQASLADNDGERAEGEKIEPLGHDGYFATLPLEEMLVAARAVGVPCRLSLSAGTFVCNRVLYGVLHWAKTAAPRTRAGFLHVPFLPGQVLDKPDKPSMAMELMERGLEAMLKVLAEK